MNLPDLDKAIGKVAAAHDELAARSGPSMNPSGPSRSRRGAMTILARAAVDLDAVRTTLAGLPDVEPLPKPKAKKARK